MNVKNLLQVLGRFTRTREAVAAMEYAIVAAGVGAAVWAFTDNVKTAIETIGSKVEATATTAPAGTVGKPAPAPNPSPT